MLDPSGRHARNPRHQSTHLPTTDPGSAASVWFYATRDQRTRASAIRSHERRLRSSAGAAAANGIRRNRRSGGREPLGSPGCRSSSSRRNGRSARCSSTRRTNDRAGSGRRATTTEGGHRRGGRANRGKDSRREGRPSGQSSFELLARDANAELRLSERRRQSTYSAEERTVRLSKRAAKGSVPFPASIENRLNLGTPSGSSPVSTCLPFTHSSSRVRPSSPALHKATR